MRDGGGLADGDGLRDTRSQSDPARRIGIFNGAAGQWHALCMRLFAEVLGGVVLGMAVSFAIRYRFGGFEPSAGDMFFGVLWVAIAMYAYILMGHIDRQRRQLDFRG